MVDGEGIPLRKRVEFTAIAVRRWSPFPDPQFHAEWVGNKAMVWAWSQSRVLGFGDDASPVDAVAPRRLTPESLHRGEPLADGEQLLGMAEGVEGRIWRGHVLVASEWWPGAPTRSEWSVFRRGAGLGPASEVPQVAQQALRAVPWSAPRAHALEEFAKRYQSYIPRLVAAVGALLLSVQLASGIALEVSLAQVEDNIAEQDEGLQAILAAREQADRDALEIERLLQLRPPAGQVDLLATFAELVPAQTRVLEWQMPNPERLEVSVEIARPDPRGLVEAWEASGRFEGVTVELGTSAEELAISAGIVRDTVAAPAAAVEPVPAQ